MKKLTDRIARILLGIVAAVVPVVIAACYGMYYSFTRSGRALDARTGNGINGIRVSCNLPGGATDTAYTLDDGWFYLEGDVPCETVTFEDTDGAANGGAFAAKTVPLPPESESFVVQLDVVP